MKFFATALSTAALVVSAVAQSGLTINTPTSAVVCQPLLISWTGGTGPYFLALHNGDDPNGAALVDFGQQSGNSLTWNVNLNQKLSLSLRDSTGLTAQTAAFTPAAGSNTSCVGQSVSTSAGGSAPAATGGATSAAGGSSPTTAGQTTSRAGATSAASAGASAAATSSQPSEGRMNVANAGVAGLVGAALLAVMA